MSFIVGWVNLDCLFEGIRRAYVIFGLKAIQSVIVILGEFGCRLRLFLILNFNGGAGKQGDRPLRLIESRRCSIFAATNFRFFKFITGRNRACAVGSDSFGANSSRKLNFFDGQYSVFIFILNNLNKPI